MKKILKKKSGFTLIELMIVISIMVVLAAIAVPKYASIQKDAKVKADIATAKTIADAVTVLVAQEKVAESIGTLAAPIEISEDSEDDNAIAIGSYLQTIPTSAVYKDKNFKVYVVDGIATICVDSDATPSIITEVYPTLNPQYGE